MHCFCKNFLELWISVIIIVFVFNAKTFAIAILVFFLFFLLVTFSGWTTAKSLITNVLTLVIKKMCDQVLTHFLDALRHIYVKIFSLSCSSRVRGTLRCLCTVTSNLQHPKRHKKLPEPTARNSEISKLYS